MNQQREQLIDEIYGRALDLAGAEREAYLRDACADEDMRTEVLALVAAAESAHDEFDSHIDEIRDRVWSDVVSEQEPASEDLAGERIGHWRLGDRIARGGLATVYVAQRDDGEFEQRVAFKVLRRGLDTDDVVARFRAERQILSALDHPAIAKILDGGALPDGRPYLVLEYVDGEPITAWCARNAVDVETRVRLIIDVLHGLQHAHRHTVVHRDIKPSNILVSSEGNVALLDFGIAKLLDPEAVPGSSSFTRTGVSLLTPGYGSPEQHAGEPVTTASDIYQVGVVLYELLSGKRPDFARDRTQASAPSQHVTGRREKQKVRGDLDAIVQKAMHVDPARRYGSASEMIADLERFLDGNPVLAQPDSLVYRMKKLFSRRPWLLPGMAILAFGIGAYVVTLTMYSNEVRREQLRAEAAQDFLVDLLGSPNPFAPADSERGRNITVVEALEIGAARLETELADQPEIRAALLGSIAEVYSSLDQSDEAIELGEQALRLNRELYGARSEAVPDVLRLLAVRYEAAGDYEKAAAYYAEQLDIAAEHYSSGSPELGVAQVYSGNFIAAQGQIEAGAELLMQGVDNLRPHALDHAEDFVWAVNTADWYRRMNEKTLSLALLEEGLAVAEQAFGADSFYAATVRLSIGRNALYAGDLQRSQENYQHALDVFEHRLGSGHSDTLTARQDYAVALNVTGNYREAEDVFREIAATLVKMNGEQHRDVADIYQNLATSITYQGRYDESLPLHRKAYEIYRAVISDHFLVAFPLLSIASIEVERGDGDAAYAAASEALERLEATIPGTYATGVSMCLTGLALELQGDTERGSALVRDSHALILTRQTVVPKYMKLCRVPSANVTGGP